MPTRTDINKSASFASVNAALRALGFKASDLTFKKARGYTGYLTGEDVAHAEGGIIPIYSSPIEFSSVGAWVQEILSRVEQDGQFSPSDETFDRVDRAREALKRAAMGAKSNPRRRPAPRRRNGVTFGIPAHIVPKDAKKGDRVADVQELRYGGIEVIFGTASTDWDGRFELRVAPGKYSKVYKTAATAEKAIAKWLTTGK